MQKLMMGTSPSTWNFGSKWPRWGEIADFRSIFARSEKSSIITNSKSHTGFRLVPTSMTLNDLERHNSPFCVFTEFHALLAKYVTVVEYRLIISVKLLSPSSSLPLLAITNHPAARSLCDSWASCYQNVETKQKPWVWLNETPNQILNVQLYNIYW